MQVGMYVWVAVSSAHAYSTIDENQTETDEHCCMVRLPLAFSDML